MLEEDLTSERKDTETISPANEEVSLSESNFVQPTKKTLKTAPPTNNNTSQCRASTPTERDFEDLQSPKGMATTRTSDRTQACFGTAGPAAPIFHAHDAITHGGVLFAIPALVAQGLLKVTAHYSFEDKHYYSVQSILLILCVMVLLRINCPEQLKQFRSGEMGRFLGIDRFPEVKCLRQKISILSDQKQAHAVQIDLMNHWLSNENETSDSFKFILIDGHQRTYCGYKANLPSKFISREKLCLSATTEYWVNDSKGMPLMVATAELSEKLMEAITTLIIPELKKTNILSSAPIVDHDQDVRLTFVFDREAYSPDFFKKLWDEHRIAIISYRKNVQNKWDHKLFEIVDVKMNNEIVKLQIYEQKLDLKGNEFREIRKLSESGHQTAIITSHPSLAMSLIAEKMFGRWVQENYFKYIKENFKADSMFFYRTCEVDPELVIRNPEYTKKCSEIRRNTEQMKRLSLKLTVIRQKIQDCEDGSSDQDSNTKIKADIKKATKLKNKEILFVEDFQACKVVAQELIAARKLIATKIPVKQMPEESKYNKLESESKLLKNLMISIAYRAETLLTNLIQTSFNREEEEKRMLIKQIMQANADIYPDYHNKVLHVTLQSLSSNRCNQVAITLAEELNKTETIFPDTDLVMEFSVRSKN